MVAGGLKAHERFCNECGRRPLPGVHRHKLGARWTEYGMPYMRCSGCERIVNYLKEGDGCVCSICFEEVSRHERALDQATVLWEEDQRQKRLL